MSSSVSRWWMNAPLVKRTARVTRTASTAPKAMSASKSSHEPPNERSRIPPSPDAALDSLTPLPIRPSIPDVCATGQSHPNTMVRPANRYIFWCQIDSAWIQSMRIDYSFFSHNAEARSSVVRMRNAVSTPRAKWFASVNVALYSKLMANAKVCRTYGSWVEQTGEVLAILGRQIYVNWLNTRVNWKNKSWLIWANKAQLIGQSYR